MRVKKPHAPPPPGVPSSYADQVAFVVMPSTRNPTGRTEKHVPAEVDFDALWERVYQPVLEHLGYQAVRADRHAGALAFTQMIQRLAIPGVVIADITLANASVYYEIGIRHAPKERGCVLISADWARPVFDLDQMRQLRFPLIDGDIEDDEAVKAGVEALRTGLMGLVRGVSPEFEAVPGFPGSGSSQGSAFEVDTRAVCATPKQDRPAWVRALF